MSDDVMGPVEFAVLEFEGSEFNGEVAPALAALVEDGVVDIIDLVFLTKDLEGDVIALELSEIGPEVGSAFDAIEGAAGGLFADDDLVDIGEMLRPGSSAILVMWEAVWARRLTGAVLGSGGRMVAHERIDRDAVSALLAGDES